MKQEEKIIQGDVESIAFGGQGILRHEGLVVFVPFTVPGDHITCKIIKTKKSFAEAGLLEVLDSGPERIKAPCRYYGTCGGCQLQHMSYAAQLDYKRACVEDALQRIGHLKANVQATISTQQQWAYRRHITLTLEERSGKFVAGYIATDNTSLVKVTTCPIFISESDHIIEQVQEMASELECAAGNSGKVSIWKVNDGKYIIQISLEKMPVNCTRVCEYNLSKNTNWVGIAVNASRQSLHFGTIVTSCNIEGMTFQFSPHVFMQNHPEQSANIYRHICEITKDSLPKHILDLYCGIGITSLLLAKQAGSVVGVEYNREAVSLAQENAKLNHVKNVNFIAGDAAKAIKQAIQKQAPDFVLVNPPRTGMDAAVTQQIIKIKPNDIVYISCMPATLARDLKSFCAEGYRIVSCLPFDMFPQTAHVETVVHLRC